MRHYLWATVNLSRSRNCFTVSQNVSFSAGTTALKESDLPIKALVQGIITSIQLNKYPLKIFTEEILTN